MDPEEEVLIIAVCLYELLNEEQRKTERKRKTQWFDNLKRARERRLSRKHPISVQNLRKKPHLARSRKNTSEYPNQVKDPGNEAYYDEKENYESPKNSGISIKVEPGLTDDLSNDDTKDFLAGCSQLKEEANPDSVNQEKHGESMVDVDNITTVKQETGSYPNSPTTGVKIKIEPDLSEDDTSHDHL